MEPSAPPREWRRGWPVVLGSAAMAGVGAGLYQNLSSLFMPALQQATGATRGEIGASVCWARSPRRSSAASPIVPGWSR